MNASSSSYNDSDRAVDLSDFMGEHAAGDLSLSAAAAGGRSDMVIVYRIAGLGGEATEEQVRELKADHTEKKLDPEKYSMCSVVCEKFGPGGTVGRTALARRLGRPTDS
eukprot:986623_1